MAGKIEIGNLKISWGNAAQKSTTGLTYDLSGSDAFTRLIGFQDNFSNEPVTERRAHGLATVYTCINVRSRTIASLPIQVLREEGKVKKLLTDHPAYWLLSQQPNQYMSAANLMLTSMIHSDSWGNSLIGISRYARTGEPKSLELICPWDWNCIHSDGEIWYNIRGLMYPSRDVLHYRWFSYDGIYGISPIRLNQMTFGAAFKQARYQGMALGQRPPGILTYEGNLTPEQRAQNQNSWKTDLQLGNTPVLSGRWNFQPIMIPPGDAEYLGTEGMTDQKIYGIFQLPPTFAQNYERATWSNAEQADIVYAKHTVTPICTIMEKENNMKLFSEKEKVNTYTKFNMNGLLRGDIAARAAFYTAMRNIGGLNADEMRSFEDLNAYDGGEIYTVQSSNIPVDQLRTFYESKVAPSANTNPGQPPQTQPGQQRNGKFNYEYNGL